MSFQDDSGKILESPCYQPPHRDANLQSIFTNSYHLVKNYLVTILSLYKSKVRGVTCMFYILDWHKIGQ